MRTRATVWLFAAACALLAVALAIWWYFGQQRRAHGIPAVPAPPSTFPEQTPRMSTADGQKAVNALFGAKTNCAEVASILRGSVTDLVIAQERNSIVDESKIVEVLKDALERMNRCNKDAWIQMDDVPRPLQVTEFQTLIGAMLISIDLGALGGNDNMAATAKLF